MAIGGSLLDITRQLLPVLAFLLRGYIAVYFIIPILKPKLLTTLFKKAFALIDKSRL